MATPGNDPFSGTNTKDILQHIISPKVVSDGSSGYTVKTDVINVDNLYTASGIYAAGYIGAPVGESAGVGTVTPLNIQSTTGATGVALIQASPYLGTSPSSLNGLARINFTTTVSTNKTTITLQPNSGSGVVSGMTVADTGVSTPLGFTGKNKGTFTFAGATVTVSNSNVTADSDILITVKTLGGTGTGQAYVSAKVASTSFTVTSVAGAGDTSTFNYIIFN